MPTMDPSDLRRLRVCIVTETFPPEVNGVAMTVNHLVSGLLARGHQVQLVRPRQSVADRSYQDGAMTVVTVSGMALPFYRDLRVGFAATGRLIRLWRQIPPDLVHVVTEGPLGGSAVRAAKRINLPLLSSFHTNFHVYSGHYGFGFLRGPITAYLRRFHNGCDCTLVPTEELALLLRRLGFQHVQVLSRGVDTRLFSPQRRSLALRQSWGAGPEDLVTLYVGRLAAEKNIELAVRAFGAIQRERPRSRFVLVGDGPLAASLREKNPDFVFCGTRRGEDLAAHYASADLFLFPSLSETFGNVVLEAMASGLVVVAFDYAAAHQHLSHGRCGLLAPPEDDAAFVALACGLAGDRERLQLLGRQARRATETVDWDNIYQHLEAVFLAYAGARRQLQ